jgi:hypothetical protein
VGEAAFSSLSGLKKLFDALNYVARLLTLNSALDKNQITALDSRALMGIEQLEWLSLAFNLLTSVPPAVFIQNPSMHFRHLYVTLKYLHSHYSQTVVG